MRGIGWLTGFAADDRGHDLIEYALLVALAVVALLGGLHLGSGPPTSADTSSVSGS